MSVAIIVVVAAGMAAWHVAAQRKGSVPAADTTVEGVFDDLPPQLRPPAQVADLPSDRGVGRGALMYHLGTAAGGLDPDTRPFTQNDVYLVTRSGEHFRAGRTPAATGPLNLSLSSDGRWLAAKRDGQWRVRDLSGTAVYEVADGYEPWLWSTDARSLLLAKLSVDGRSFGAMALPGGGVRSLDVRTSNLATEVAFIAGRELAVFDVNPPVGPSAPPELSITLNDVVTGATRTLPVVVPGQTKPGEVVGPVLPLWHAGGSPPSIWVEVGRPDLLPTSAPEGMLVAPSVALLGVDVTSGAATARIEVPSIDADGPQLCRGVVADGVVLQRWTATNTELIVVDPRRDVRRVVTTLPENVTVLAPGARA
ncbi:hypothetical protein [Micromonospora sp. NPDC049799]|uniref:hypothetical protein n=1 Tax=Micromonospora sp. NPDC049799 TaxID=3154741 RepID=UPI0033D47A59